MSDVSNMLTAVGGSALGGVMGLALGGINDKRQMKQQERLQQLQIAGQKEMGIFNREQQMKLWEDTNYKAQVEQMKKAGLSVSNMYGGGGAGGATAAATSGSVSGGTAAGTTNEAMAGMGLMLQNQNLAAQRDLIKAQTNNIDADTANKTGLS